MKTIESGLLAHMAGSATTLAYGLRITRTDAEVYGFTSHDRDVTISSVTYEAAQGLDVTSLVTSSGLNVDNLELTTIDDGTLFTREEVMGGVWQNARFLCFRYNWASPPATLAGVESLCAGTFGAVRLLNGKVVAELRGLQQYLQQPVGEVSSKTCRARFGDARCGFDVATRTHTPSTVTAVASREQFTASGRAEADDYFGDGEIVWLTGDNTGIRHKVKAFASGVFTLYMATEATIQTGDTFTAIGGCRKRLEDCIARSNVLNFQGEPHRPGIDAVTASPEVSV